ncbi:uncharacterized protein LOC110770709 [Prunus avium]|uniref:Uncharacterized protein LOC110770709 n=1 Tax=Prunus avium TaxID=42229 RepID=A0A6P5TUC9_PRUAV|nr:uncharacterized protein LOC110770709 [Prunus avium]
MASPSSDYSPSIPLSSIAVNPNFTPVHSITIQNIGSMVPIKLKRDNYLLWSSLFALIFRHYKLSGIVDGFEPPPPRFLRDSSGNCLSQLNPAYELWYEKDHNLIIWLNSTLSDDLIPFTVAVTSAHELWQNLEKRFAGKGSSSISEYLQHIKSISDALAAAGTPVDEFDLIAIILNGLSDEYESFVTSIELRLGSTTVDELHGLLLNKEVSLARKKHLQSSHSS